MVAIYVVLLIGAVVCFGLASAQVNIGKVNLIALGLLLATLVPLIQQFQRLT